MTKYLVSGPVDKGHCERHGALSAATESKAQLRPCMRFCDGLNLVHRAASVVTVPTFCAGPGTHCTAGCIDDHLVPCRGGWWSNMKEREGGDFFLAAAPLLSLASVCTEHQQPMQERRANNTSRRCAGESCTVGSISIVLSAN